MLQLFFWFLGFLFFPGLFLYFWLHFNYDYDIGCIYDFFFTCGNVIWDFVLVYIIFKLLRRLWRLCVRLLCRICRLLWSLLCRVYSHCRAQADRHGNENE